ncbi:MAG: metallophosphoesterase family protein [Vicinamibacterales bacterium]
MTRTRLGFAAALAIAGTTVLGSGQSEQPSETDRAVLLAAGDIARCGKELGGAMATGRLLDRLQGTILSLGDHAYTTGAASDFEQCYEPAWGRHKGRTRPTPGNHDYFTENGRAYFTYFGENAGPERRGYYSFEVAGWHIISLNSNIDSGPSSNQIQWLKNDLKTHPSVCTLAYWHIPLFSTGDHGGNPKMRDAWEVLHQFGADVVLNGHDHDYERFQPLDSRGRPDKERGIRQFVVGTGGAGVYRFNRTLPISEVRDNQSYGVLKLTLSPTSYDWEFIAAVGTFRDSGSASCVDLPVKP